MVKAGSGGQKRRDSGIGGMWEGQGWSHRGGGKRLTAWQDLRGGEKLGCVQLG